MLLRFPHEEFLGGGWGVGGGMDGWMDGWIRSD